MEPPRITASTWSSIDRREVNSSNLGSSAARGISSPIEKLELTLSKLVFQGEYPGWSLSLVSSRLVPGDSTKGGGAGSSQEDGLWKPPTLISLCFIKASRKNAVRIMLGLKPDPPRHLLVDTVPILLRKAQADWLVVISRFFEPILSK